MRPCENVNDVTDNADVRALVDRLLPRVQKPARYAGGEFNAVRADWSSTAADGKRRVRLALAFPDVYDIGMSNLGVQVLYEVVNRDGRFLAERAFAPWFDMEAEMRRARLPLFGLESRHSLAEFDIIGFTLPYELDHANVLNMLNLAGIPVRSRDRGPDHPIIIAGGSTTTNPEPMADFIDAFLIGEGEESLPAFLALFRDLLDGEGRAERQLLLRTAAATIPGCYVPSLYAPRYGKGGTFEALEPLPGAPALPVRKAVVDLVDYPLPTRPVIPFMETVHDRAAIEIMRGCGRGCRFCQADLIYRPRRVRPRGQIAEMARTLLASTGYDELSLLSLSSADIKGIDAIVQDAIDMFDEDTLTIAMPSTRVDAFNVHLAALVERGRRSGITFAPEAGTERLRNVIHKGVSEAESLHAAELAFARGWQTIKLYFMIGLPTETDDDLAGIGHLAQAVLNIGRKHHGRRARVTVGVSTMVPKAHTPFQWAAQSRRDEISRKIGVLHASMRDRGLRMSWHDPESTIVEGVLSRGDRRVGTAIYGAWRRGARFDAWNRHLRFEAWQAGMADAGLDIESYGAAERDIGAPLPWDHVDVGVPRWHLAAQWNRARSLDLEPRQRDPFVLLHGEEPPVSTAT